MARKQGSYQYDDAFRAQAVALVIDQKMPVSAAAKQVGVSYETLRKWVYESGRAREDDESKSDKQRIRELERELKAARMERDILKEAVRSGLPSVNARNEIPLYRRSSGTVDSPGYELGTSGHAARVLCVEEASCIGEFSTSWQVGRACTQDLHGEQPYVWLAADHTCVAQ